jgi:ferredoxin-thioredoxin reductase catalytic subunit
MLKDGNTPSQKKKTSNKPLNSLTKFLFSLLQVYLACILTQKSLTTPMLPNHFGETFCPCRHLMAVEKVESIKKISWFK